MLPGDYFALPGRTRGALTCGTSVGPTWDSGGKLTGGTGGKIWVESRGGTRVWLPGAGAWLFKIAFLKLYWSAFS